MTKLTIVANIHANPDRIDLVKAELEKLLPITRAEQGCLQYDLHRDNDHPAHFMVFENWESRELWQRHMNAPHLAAYLQATDGAVVAEAHECPAPCRLSASHRRRRRAIHAQRNDPHRLSASLAIRRFTNESCRSYPLPSGRQPESLP
ncbi:MAG: quinol monooxygenase YgiN [Candidatus Accumulibacter regalis]